MTEILSFFLGFLQGITEFLPVSSSGHLALFEIFFGEKKLLKDFLKFDIILHFGSLCALLLFFWKKIFLILKDFFSLKGDKKVGVQILLGAIPVFFTGFFLADFLEKFSHSLSFLQFSFLISGIFFLISEFFYKKNIKKKDLSFSKSFFIGILQSISIIPGISRSGTSFSAGILFGIKRKKALEFSFLIGIPVICGAITYLFFKNGTSVFEIFGLKNILIGFLSSFVFSFLSISFLIKFFEKFSLKIFGFYLITLSLFLFFLDK